jgi:hypothetical protein
LPVRCPRYCSVQDGRIFAGLVLFGWGAILLLAVVYSLDWFQNLDQSLRIFQIVLVISVFGGVAGLFLYGMEGGVLGWTYTLLFAELGGAVSAIFFRRRDDREEREYEAEMRKYGKEL